MNQPTGPCWVTDEGFRELVLERLEGCAVTRVHRQLLYNSKLEVGEVAGFTANQLSVRLSKLIYSNPLGKLEYRFPASPYEYFRSKYFPKFGRLGRWWLRRRPVLYHYHVASAVATFPDAQIVTPPSFGRMTVVIRDQQTSVDY